MTTEVAVPIEQLTDRQLTIHHIALIHQQNVTLTRIESYMADLTASVAALQEAVDSIAVRFASQLQPLTDALAEAQAQLAAAAAEDITQNEALAEAVDRAQAAVDQASQAADAINAEVAELNSLGAEPDVPVETVPVEQMPPAPSTNA